MGITCRLHVLVVALCVAAVVVKGAKNCEEALDECHVCQERYCNYYEPSKTICGESWSFEPTNGIGGSNRIPSFLKRKNIALETMQNKP